MAAFVPKAVSALVTGVVMLAAVTFSLQVGGDRTAPLAAQEQQPGTDHPVLAEYYNAQRKNIQFPDFGYMLSPDDYQGRVFQLSQDYPQTMPEVDAELAEILQADFMGDWQGYMFKVRDYIFAGNIEHHGYENDFFLEDNSVRPWYHVPWQHWGPNGREGFHGLTREGPIAQQQLDPLQTRTSSAYAVGFYNALGGYTIGQVWAGDEFPHLEYMADGRTFPNGTVVGKFLFTTLDDSQVSYLTNPVEWQAYVQCGDAIWPSGLTCTDRAQTTVRLVQMDIMVRDTRAPSGWLFGTFVYNGNQQVDTRGESERWYNLVPVGLMWGNDPEVTTASSNPRAIETKINPALQETVINTDTTVLPPMHLGWGSRLNGPLDNPMSSCMSCHSTAQYPVVSAIMPQFNNPPVPAPDNGSTASSAWMRWFRNIPAGEAFDPGQAIATDFSLQLAASIANYMDYKAQEVHGHYGIEYWSNGHDIRRNIVEP
jgi:hypothetical protein